MKNQITKAEIKIKETAEKYCHKCKKLGICEQDRLWVVCEKIKEQEVKEDIYSPVKFPKEFTDCFKCFSNKKAGK